MLSSPYRRWSAPTSTTILTISSVNMFVAENMTPSRMHELPSTTPPAKRRRGRPPKCPEGSNGVSPAANLSAAVLKQGTPRASAPVMRISPLRSAKSSEDSPVQRRTVNPSPKGGTLMKLDGLSNSGKSTRSKKNSFYRMTPNTISLHTQKNIQSLTSGETTEPKADSVNPLLLLSSPITSSKINEINKNRLPAELRTSQKSKKVVKQSFPLSSSPVTPSSSCFSSIMQSSPLYQGYYVSQSSPGTTIVGSSPVKFQVKPMEISDDSKASDINFKKMTELPVNPSNSPDLRSRDPSPKTTTTSPVKMFEQYRLSMSIDENGQARITKIFTGNQTSKSSSSSSSSKITRHHSMASLGSSQTQNPLSTFKQITNQELSMFIEPSRVTSDSFFSEIDDHLGFDVSTPIQQQFGTFSEEDGSEGALNENDFFEDESMNFDARRALMKMIRRSV
jgi:hypothetical protein